MVWGLCREIVLVNGDLGVYEFVGWGQTLMARELVDTEESLSGCVDGCDQAMDIWSEGRVGSNGMTVIFIQG